MIDEAAHNCQAVLNSTPIQNAKQSIHPHNQNILPASSCKQELDSLHCRSTGQGKVFKPRSCITDLQMDGTALFLPSNLITIAEIAG